MDVGTWIALIAAMSGLVTGIVSPIISKRKTRAEIDKLRSEQEKDGADAAKVLGETAALLLEPARKQVSYLQGEVENLADQLDKAQAEVRRLRTDMAALTDRLKLAQRLLTENGVPFPPIQEG